jgi:hypothetical protein
MWHSASDSAVHILRRHRRILTSLIEIQAELTSELLAGLDSVILYRGVKLPVCPDAVFAPELKPLASFSADFGVAQTFAAQARGRGTNWAPVVMCADVPISRIQSTPATGFGVYDEREVVLAAGRPADRVAVVWPDFRYSTDA